MKNHTTLSVSIAALLASCGLAFAQASNPAKPATRPATPAAAAPAKAPAGKATPATATEIPFTVETVATGLSVPWDMGFTQDGRIFVTERTGTVRAIVDGTLLDKPMLKVEGVWPRGENGLMSLCLHPDFAKNHYVYLSFGQRTPEQDIRVVRYTEKDNALTEPKVILSGIPAAGNHAGCRVRFGPDGKLYISTGETFNGEIAQDLSNLGGKIHRVNDDGTIPSDNPFNNAEGKAKNARAEIWSYGHRNPQGLAWNDAGQLIETEHGPSGSDGGTGGDEINIVEKGKNYGWNIVHNDESQEGMVSPIRQYTPAIAPSSGMVYTGDQFPAWKGSFFFGALGGLRGPNAEPGLFRVEIKDGKVVKEERFLPDLGRIRFVAQGPDGNLYVTTSNKDGRAKPREGDDRIVKLVPKK